MTSRGYITVGEGSSWRSSGLPAKLLMSMMMMIPMLSPYTSATIQMIGFSPADGFTIGAPNAMNILCSYATTNFISFRLMQNNNSVVEMQYNQISERFETTKNEKDFRCTLTRSPLNSGMVSCKKWNLTCKDVASYRCLLSDTDISNPELLKVKSSIKSLALAENDFRMSRTATFKCTAYAALPFPEEIVFQWTVTNSRKEVVNEDRVKVWGSDKCYTEVTSSYKYAVRFDSFASPSIISCTVFNQTRTNDVNPPMPKESVDASAGLQYRKWVLVVNLILLLLTVSISC
ncbi:uncharacterized protein LOC106882738 [Octopus bimaculoides]|uniref:Ig-like domain-containing protein n=1 Tax=Octopus bimaculoides TaxID=37653 RepID=A0A0L8FKL0_OCTBM|nr:uncharacterized protein LOC106882738 [Octopus bimaculoides]|eukprot:XP_014788997.1 PREDICTED: uncharacterized protein LOC106882738 [Octopus bimaculoides]